jgi:hypothetical protein
MLKHTFILLFSILIFQSAQAQKDTLLYYMKNDGEIVEEKAAADYFALIVKPAAGEELFPVYEFYPNGKRKMIAASKVQSIDYQLEGTSMQFFPNGKRKAVISYKDGAPVGDETEYYPNGKIYALSKFDGFKKLVMECRDTAGNVIAQNGEGKWIKLDPDFKQVIAEGPIAKGMPNGEWHETLGDSIKRTVFYSKGAIKSGVSYKGGKEYPFKEAIVRPISKDHSAFVKSMDFVLNKANAMRGPNEVTFMVDIDGSLSDFKLTKGTSPDLDNALLEALKTSSKWSPGLDYGIPTKMMASVGVGISMERRSGRVERGYMTSSSSNAPPQVGDRVESRVRRQN